MGPGAERAPLTAAEAGRLAGRARAAPAAGPALVLPSGLLVALVVVPVAALVWRAATAPGAVAALASPLVGQALRVTAITTALSVAIVVTTGTPLAYLLARRSFRWRPLVELAIDLPLVLPPVVAGVALLMAFGRRGLLGPPLGTLGVELPFTTAAVVLAQVFVAGPFYVRGAWAGFAAIDPEVEEAAAIDGASSWQSFRRVTLPLALPGIASGVVLCLGRALSEFGATLMFAGNFMGETQTMSLAIVQAMESDLDAALALAVLLVATSALALAATRALGGRRPAG